MHGVLTASVISLVLLSGIVINILYGVDYIDGLLLSVFLVSTLALGISWFWNPGVGYSGLGVLWNRYTMTIGGPFEIWINTLTTLIEEPYISSGEFLQSACDHLVENDWLNGMQWQFSNHAITSGRKEGVLFEHPLSESISVSIYFKSDPGQALRQHTILLVRMAFQFYLAKLNQEKMRAEAYFETIHHTGARLTHDIKNILQSIKASLDIVDLHPDKSSDLPSRLLSQNLNQISQRLETTLTKLKEPELSTPIRLADIQSWYNSFSKEHHNDNIDYRADIEINHPIPCDLFDSVISNLVANAQEKPETSGIVVDTLSNHEMIMVTVCDNGGSIDPEVEGQLFNKPVSSGRGMGIGLYQSAIMARTFSYELELTNNEAGRVCFSLFQHRGE
jgi:signal transduction histidine kinase